MASWGMSMGQCHCRDRLLFMVGEGYPLGVLLFSTPPVEATLPTPQVLPQQCYGLLVGGQLCCRVP
eukprot:2579499-Rhodomonas_salina.1